jgi:hypothetical protein
MQPPWAPMIRVSYSTELSAAPGLRPSSGPAFPGPRPPSSRPLPTPLAVACSPTDGPDVPGKARLFPGPRPPSSRPLPTPLAVVGSPTGGPAVPEKAALFPWPTLAVEQTPSSAAPGRQPARIQAPCTPSRCHCRADALVVRRVEWLPLLHSSVGPRFRTHILWL